MDREQRLLLRTTFAELVGDSLRAHGDLLPVTSISDQLVLFNTHIAIDALDTVRSEVKRFSPGKLMQIRRHEFHAKAVDAVGALRLTNMLRSDVFLREWIVNELVAAGVSGTKFDLAWSDS